MEEFYESEQFSFWSHEASQGSCKNTTRRSRQPKMAKIAHQQAKCSQYADTKTSSRNERKRLAGLRSREKKKTYVKTLEEKVKQLG